MKKLFPVFIFLCLVSCQEIQRTPKPDNLIREEKMVDVLTEISLLHGARSYNKGLMEEKGIDPYPYIMEKFGIDSVQLVKSNNYYAENTKQYQRIYEKVKRRLDTLLVKYDSLREVEEQRLDSIKKANPDSILVRPQVMDTLDRDSIRRSLPQPVSRDREIDFVQDTTK